VTAQDVAQFWAQPAVQARCGLLRIPPQSVADICNEYRAPLNGFVLMLFGADNEQRSALQEEAQLAALDGDAMLLVVCLNEIRKLNLPPSEKYELLSMVKSRWGPAAFFRKYGWIHVQTIADVKERAKVAHFLSTIFEGLVLFAGRPRHLILAMLYCIKPEYFPRQERDESSGGSSESEIAIQRRPAPAQLQLPVPTAHQCCHPDCKDRPAGLVGFVDRVGLLSHANGRHKLKRADYENLERNGQQ